MELDHSSPYTIPIRAASQSPILVDSVFLLFLRLVYFYLSRKFLLSALNPTLRDLSKSEDTLPAPVLAEEPRIGHVAPPSDNDDLDTEEDVRNFTPASSYPPSPVKTSTLPLRPARDPFTRRVSDEPPHVSDSIELVNLTQKLRDVEPKILQLTHGRRALPRSSKKATRGLSQAARLLFSLTFAEGCNLVTLVIFHALGVLHSRSRHVNFSFSLHFVLALVILVIPMAQCLFLTYRSRDASQSTPSLSFTTRMAIALLPFALYCFLFTRIPPYITAIPSVPFEMDLDMTNSTNVPSPITPQPPTASPEGWEGGGWLAPSLGRLVVLGVIVLGLLSGFGAVRTAWGFMEHVWGGGSRPIDDLDILQAERSLYRVRHDLVTRREELSQTPTSSTPSRSWVKRVFASGEDASLEAELRGLEAMERQTSVSLRTMKSKKKLQEYGSTIQGKVYNLVGYIFAIYCAARLLMCIPSIFFTPLSTSSSPDHVKGNTNGDWISFLLALGISHLPTGTIDIDVAVWSRAISLLLTGLLILSSLTQVLRSLTRILRLTSKTVGAGFLLLSLGQLFATYTISLLVQFRTSLPPAPAVDTDPFSPFYSNATIVENTVAADGPADSLLSTLPDFRVFGRLFDLTFLLAALSTAVYRYIAMKVNAADDGDVYR